MDHNSYGLYWSWYHASKALISDPEPISNTFSKASMGPNAH